MNNGIAKTASKLKLVNDYLIKKKFSQKETIQLKQKSN